MKSEKAIIQAVLEGDINQYALLVERNSDKVYGLALSLVKNREEAEEVTQDVFLKALRALETYRGTAKFSSYLYRICYNESMNKIRGRREKVGLEDLPKSVKPEGDFFSLKGSEQKRYLSMGLDRLNPDFRTVLVLFYLQEQSHKEIVEITGFSLSQVKVKLYRGRKALREILNEILGEEIQDLF